MKLKVKAPFSMASHHYNPGDIVEVNETKAKDLAHLKLVSTGKEVKEPPKDKMVGKGQTKGKK